jgi:adenine-specific DNA-methyltransferase
VSTKRGEPHNGLFGRADEYYFFVLLGDAGVQPTVLGEGWITAKGRTHRGEIRWDLLRKSGASPTRDGHPDTFYAFFVTEDGKTIHSIGDPIGVGSSRHDVVPPDGTFAVWPIRQDGSEGRWRLQPSTARQVMSEGGIRLGAAKGESTPVYYLSEGEREKIASGMYQVTGYREDGSAITSVLDSPHRRIVPGTQWRIPSHDSTQYGSRLLAKLLHDRKFPYPKSLYAVEDALRFFVGPKPDATIVDFFAGSGTTAHAIMRLNRQDGGRRRTISVTNNEVSAEEQAGLRAQGLRPGDPEWEALGICDYITKPRILAAVSGAVPTGEPIQGDYKFVDEFPMADGLAENVEFFTMTYEAPRAVAHNRSFDAVAPLLWLRAGAEGARIEKAADNFAIADVYGVLFDMDCSHKFLAALAQASRLRTAFIVTDDDRAFQMVCSELPPHVEPVRLYDSYLTNFAINTGRE